MHDSELIRRYTLDRAGIMFVTELRDMLTSPTPCWMHSARNGRNHYINYINIFGNWKNATMRSDDLGLLQHFQNLIMSLFISYEIR